MNNMTEPYEATAVALRLALRVLDGCSADRIRDLLLTEVFNADGAEGVLEVATAAVLTVAELMRRIGGDDPRGPLIAAITRCEGATAEELY